MANFLDDEAMDGGLDWIIANGDTFHLLSSPVNGVYGSIAAADLGNVDITGDLSIVAGATDGRSVSMAEQTVTPSGNGTVTDWAVSNGTDDVMASGAFSSPFAVTSGVDVTIAAFAVATHRDPA